MGFYTYISLSIMLMNKNEPIQKGKAGCYSIASSKSAQIELPLKYFNYQIEIVQCFSYVKMTQLYHNNQSKTLDVSYIFPIHPSCIVTNLQIQFGGNITRGVVMQKLQAKKQFKKHMEQGAQAVYAAYDPQSRDIMKMKIGNIAPYQQIKIILCYSHLNSLVCNMFYQFKLASTMTPRYASNLNQNQLIFSTEPQNKYKSRCNWGLTITIKHQSSRKITKIQSKSHKIMIDQFNRITFANTQLPNRDFSLYYAFQNYQRPSYLLSHNDNGTIAAISFIPKFSSLSLDDAVSQAIKGKDNEVNLDSIKGQYIFLLDRSGSMEGIRIDNAKRSLQIFLRSLPQDSYFNVLSFGSRYKYLFAKSKKYSKYQVDKAVNQINQMKADMGGTEILQAIQNLVGQPVIEGYPRQLFFLTDGAVQDVSTVLKFISKHTQYTRVNSIGIGNGCSQELIQGCAQRGKGQFAFIRDDEKPEQKIIALLQNSLSPVISKVVLTYDKSKVQSIVPNPDKIPYLLKNDIANFYITFKNKLNTPMNFELKYSSSIGKNYSESITINPQGQNCKWIENMVNYQKIKALRDSYEYNEQLQDRLHYVKKLNKQELKQQIIAQSIKHQILTDFTAFLCIDASMADNIRKFNLQKDKQKFNIKGMNPYDHMVTFSQDNNKYNRSQCNYVDECCIVNYQDPPEQLVKISKFQQVPKVYRQMQLKGKIAGKTQYFQIKGISQLPNPQKRLAYIYIVKRQETNGSWVQDFIDALFTDADKMKNTFSKVDKYSMRTFLVCQYLIRFYSNEAQFSMIIKKGMNYVNKNSNIPWTELQKLFHKYHYEPIPQTIEK